MSTEERTLRDHPDLADLDAYRTGEAAEDVARHVESCARCSRLVGELGEAARELKGASRGPEVDVPPEVDGNVRAMARARAAVVRAAVVRAAVVEPVVEPVVGKEARPRRSVYFSWPGLVAAAAAVLLAVGLTLSVRRRGPPGVTSRLADAAAGTTDTMDIDRSGRVDIVDAYLMSRRLRSGEAPAAWDFDRDGAVGEADVDRVAMRAVALVDGGI